MINERASGAHKQFVDSLLSGDKLAAAGAATAPAALQAAAQLQLAQIGVAAGATAAAASRSLSVWSGPTEGMRAVGTGSPSPAVTPPPVVQRQGPAEERELVAQLAGSRPGGSRGGDGETEEARLRDAAEVRVSTL